MHREITGTLKSITLSRSVTGKYYASLLIEDGESVSVQIQTVDRVLGIDVGLKHIADISLSGLILKLESKAKAQGKHLIKIDQWFASSKNCSSCGFKVDKMLLSVRKWDCPSCGGMGIGRDINAAINIRQQGIIKLRAEGLSVPANGGLRKSGRAPVAA